MPFASPNLDQLIGHVREAATEHSATVEQPANTNAAPDFQPLPNLPAPALAAPLIRDVHDLLLISDHRQFIASAYEALLGRAADDSGRNHYQQMLERGFGQPFVLAALRASREARARKHLMPPAGWGCAPLLHNCWRFGRFVGLGLPARWLNRLYHAWRQLRLALSGRLLAHFANQQQQLQSLLQQVATNAARHSQQLADQQQQLVDHFSQQQDKLVHAQTDWQQRLQRYSQRQQTFAAQLQTLTSVPPPAAASQPAPPSEATPQKPRRRRRKKPAAPADHSA